MSRVTEWFEDHARDPVPAGETVRGWHIVVIYVGVALTLPAFLTGGEIGLGVGLSSGVVATLVASAILAAVGLATGYLGARTRLSTYMISRHAFGRAGARIPNGLLALTLFGWFGVTAAFFAQATHALALSYLGLDLGPATWTIVGTVLMTSTALFGFKGLDKLSVVVTPLLVLLLGAAVVESLAISSPGNVLAYEGSGAFPVGAAVSMLVGGWMVGAVVLPDLTRYAVSPRHGMVGGGLSFVVGMVVVIVPSMIVAVANGNQDLVAVVVSFGWATAGLAVIVLSAWSSNDNNVYSAALGLASIVEGVAKWKITLAAGAAGGLLALIGIIDRLVPLLMGLGILIPPIAGVYVTDWLLHRESYDPDRGRPSPAFRWRAFVAWGLASGVAVATQPAEIGGLGWFSLTMIPALDALAVSCVAYLALDRVGTS
ncbi:MAG TPA: cytosine permease [Longimicrobiales bacterium]|nr:cytosine permease [Longimicrobiales bacterium]